MFAERAVISVEQIGGLIPQILRDELLSTIVINNPIRSRKTDARIVLLR